MVLFFSTPFSVCAQDNEPELKEQADKLFNKDSYVEATSLYLRLLALNPKSFEYNYKYGTCLLFNSYKKQDAFKYLNYAVTDPNITPEAYYFLGKAYHLNYQFNNAIKNYEIYKQKSSGNSNTKLAIDREIQMCQNGKNLLTTISDLVVIEKKEYSSKTFYQLYNLQNIGGNIIVTADYQSKADKKKNHVPIIHFPNNPSRIYYSSFGENDNGNKDIYARTKLPNGTWSLPQSIGTNVNTNFDEDFPYMSADGKYLYFSSKGHNSMGGYDVYRSTYDLETNTFSPPENMDFAISSADDDLFYIVDSLEENAYFASSRQSSNGNFFVYKVRVDRVPTQLSIVKGSFSSTINPENKKVSIKVTDLANGTKIGDFKSNDKGTYLITFPKGGKYEYEMKVEGSNDIYKYTANIPFLKEFKPLKQKIYEEKGDAGTNVRVVDLFNEEVEDPQGVLVDVIRARSELNVNVNQFNLDELNTQKNDKKILANLGLENASNAEILLKFDGLEQKKEEQVHQVTQLHNGSIEQAVRNADEILILQKEVKTLVAKANSSDSEADKLRLLKIAEEKIYEIESLTNQNFQLKKLADSLAPIIPNENQELKRIADVNDAVQAALQKDDFASVKIAIEKEAELLISLQKSTTTDPSDELAAQIDRIKADKNKLTVQNSEYEKTLAQIKSDISQLEKDLLAAKSKDKALIQQKIDAKQAEKTLVEQEMLRINEKIAAKTKEEQTIVDQITFIESITSVSLDSDRNPKEITTAMEKISDPNSRSVQNYVKEEVKNLERKVANNPDPKQLISSVKDTVLSEMNGFLEAQNAVDIDQNLSPEDKANASIANAQQTLVALKLQKEKLTLAKEKNPNNEQISSAISEIDSKENELNGVIEEKKNDLAKIAGTSNTISNQTDANTSEIVNNIFPEYVTKSSKLPEDAKAKIEAQNKLDAELITKIDKEIKATDKELKANPDKQEAKDKRATLEAIKSEKAAEIVERKAELAQLNNSNETYKTSSVINSTVLAHDIYPEYTDLNFEQQQYWTEQQRKDFILEELKLKDKLVKEKTANDKKLAKGEDSELSAENKVIEELIARSEANIKRIESGENNQEVDNAIAEDLKDRNEILMNSSPQTEAEATQILSDLENYARNLLNSIGNLKEDDEANKATILLREKQLETVRKRIGVVEIDLQEMRELNSSSPAEKLAIEEVQNLKNKEKELTARLAEAEKPDQKKIQNELNKNRTLQKEKQTEIETNKVVQITASNKEELKNLSISTPSDLTEVATQAEARTEKENKNSLTEVTRVKNLIQAIDQYSVGKDPYENQQTIIYTEDALIQQQRSFSIEIGEIEAEIQSLGNSKKELQKKKDLEVRKTSLEKAQESVLEQMNIIRKDKNLVVNRSVEQNTQVSFEEEQAIAANEKYKDAYELFEEIKAIETKISDKNREINQVKLLIENSTSEQVKNEQIQQLIALNKERKGFENDLKASNQKLNDLILQESSNPMKWRNVLMREVLPATLIVVSTFVDPSVVKGFEITTDKSKQVNSAEIPKDLKSPGGLVYRVQVGAFAKPLRKELFKEFSLVTGEVLPNGITRYMAGFFGSRTKVAEAQKQIQSLGYKTAFIVAYCDGKRISIAEAKR